MKFWLVRFGSVALAVAFCFALASAVEMDPLIPRLATLAGLYVTLAVSLNLINGITGQFSIGHAAFYQIGAYSAGYLSNVLVFGNLKSNGPVWLFLMMILGAMAAGVAGFVVGLPSLRLRGDYLAIVTLGFGEIIRIVVQNIDEFGGSYGLRINLQYDYLWMVWLLAIVCIAVCRNLLKTAHGLPFLAVREDEVASAAMGVKVTKVKVTAFVIGSAFAGAAGAMLAHYEAFITPTMFAMDLSFIILTMVVLGGTGSITGSVLAAIALFYLPEKLREMETVTGNALIAGFIAIVLAVAAAKRITDRHHGTMQARWGLYMSAVAGAVGLYIALSFMLGKVPALRQATYEAGNLRMVIFAATLIILMLLRPQGIFAHHEFSWSWVKRLFGKKAETTAVSA